MPSPNGYGSGKLPNPSPLSLAPCKAQMGMAVWGLASY